MRRAFGVAALAALVLAAGCLGPLADTLDGDRSPEPGAVPDPDEDVVGWEDGYWYNESLDVTTDDGLDDDELDAVVARAKARVEQIRQVEFAGSVTVETVPRSEFGGGDRSTPPPDFRTFDNAKMEALLFVGEDEDSIAVQRGNRQVSVGGFYAPSSDRIVVVTDGEQAVIEETTLAHELMHAWQDQRFDLTSFDARTRDDANAENGIVEGDAEFVQYRYDRRCGDQWDCVRPGDEGGGGGSLPNYGIFLLKYFPYSDGPAFVADRKRAGGWEAVTEVYRDPPASAEQVAHPEKYGADEPTDVALRDRTDDGWQRVEPPNRPNYGEVGQAGVAAMFVYPLYHSGGNRTIVPREAWFNRTDDGISRFDPFNYGFDYAEGWDGDRLHVYRDGDGETAYVWRLVWDSPAEAREFYGGYRQVLSYWGAERVDDHTYRIDDGPFADAFRVHVDGDTVTVVNAPDVAALSSVHPVGGGGAAPVTSTPAEETSALSPGLGLLAGVVALAIALARRVRR